MANPDKRWALAGGCLTAAAFYLFFHLLGTGFSSSVDIAHHYALVNVLREYWEVPPEIAPSLGEMGIYPRYAHLLAALIGSVLGSTYLGMQIVCVVALLLGWAAFALMATLLSARDSWLFSIGLLCLLIVNRLTFGFEIFGHEIVKNYFFAQLVAQACFLLIIPTSVFLERKGLSQIKLYALILFFSVVIEGIHLLPALQSFGYGMILVGIYALSGAKLLSRRLLYFFLLGLAGVVALYLNPAFDVMRRISENNGDLHLMSLNGLPSLTVLAAIVATISAGLLIRVFITGVQACSARYVLAKHLGAAGLSISILYFLQIILFYAGHGSEYACKKYGFSLATFLISNLSIAFVVCRSTKSNITDTTASLAFSWLQPTLILMGIWLTTIAAAHKIVDTPTFMRIERTANLIVAMGVLSHDGRNYARGLNPGGMNRAGDYLFSIAILGAPRDQDAYALLQGQDFPDPSRIGRVLTSMRNPSPWSIPSCIVGQFPDEISVVDGKCVLGKFSDFCDGEFDFSARGFVMNKMLTGFGGREAEGRWTIGPTASFYCKYREGATRPSSVDIALQPFSPDGRVQVVNVRVNGVGLLKRTLSEGETITLSVPAEIIASSGDFRLDFDMPNAISPKEIGLSAQDDRKLGIFVHRITLR